MLGMLDKPHLQNKMVSLNAQMFKNECNEWPLFLLLFYRPQHQMTPTFLVLSLEDPFSFIHRKTPTFGVIAAHPVTSTFECRPRVILASSNQRAKGYGIHWPRVRCYQHVFQLFSFKWPQRMNLEAIGEISVLLNNTEIEIPQIKLRSIMNHPWYKIILCLIFPLECKYNRLTICMDNSQQKLTRPIILIHEYEPLDLVYRYHSDKMNNNFVLLNPILSSD